MRAGESPGLSQSVEKFALYPTDFGSFVFRTYGEKILPGEAETGGKVKSERQAAQ
jgi:hypothetical protein